MCYGIPMTTILRRTAILLGRRLAILSILAAAFMAWHIDHPTPHVAPAAPALGSPEALLAQHGCWTGAAPVDMEGKTPGHVVVTVTGDQTLYSARLVPAALDQVFNGAHHGLIVRGFCR